MKTLKQLHAQRLLAESNGRLFTAFQQLKVLQAKAEKGEIQPHKARKEYSVLIARAAFYDHISGRYYKALLGLALMVKGEKYYPYRWNRSQGRYSLQGSDTAEKLESLCKNLKITLLSGNDRKGGKEADYFYLSARDRAKLADIDIHFMLFGK